ncbi:MAG: cell division protein FtsL [Gammaproteobacteria bacterium]|nr:cell division protein FtsL [Gammaproteobacteria bacterium]
MNQDTLPWMLALAIMVSAFGVIITTHQSRMNFIKLQHLEKVRDELITDWGRLQIELGAHASHGRIENSARQDLKMVLPAHQEIIMISPDVTGQP